MTMGKYILDGKTVIPADLMTWAKWLQEAGDERQVARTVIAPDEYVSTVFLGLDHQSDPNGPPLLFETMIFGGEWDEWQDRCSTWEEAEAMHAAAVHMANAKGVE